IGIGVRTVDGKAVKRKSNNRRMVSRVVLDQTFRGNVMVVLAAGRGVAAAGIEGWAFHSLGVLMPDVLVIVRAGIERIEDRYAVGEHSDVSQGRRSSRTGIGLGRPRYLVDKILVRGRVRIPRPGTD